MSSILSAAVDFVFILNQINSSWRTDPAKCLRLGDKPLLRLSVKDFLSVNEVFLKLDTV